ncbi:MAG: thiamine phosphate synthase [Gammaproteobacteria bacterium]|nr:thiamine phosphate synthase [Gammaproteobacteria bacterium]MDE0365301.1 thiamine phosphate synthase [Gammaproteobacteria bacterium]
MSPGDLPRLYAIADLAYAGSQAEFLRCIAALAEAARLHPSQLAIQVRARQASAPALVALARTSREAVGKEALLMLNGPEALAAEFGYDGIHWPEALIPGAPAESHNFAIRTAAAHSIEAVRRAHRAGATAVVYGPVFAPTWKHAEPVGLAALRHCAEASPLPVYALGGIGPDQVSECLAAGAHGIAVLSGIAGAADPVASTTRYLAAVLPERHSTSDQ